MTQILKCREFLLNPEGGDGVEPEMEQNMNTPCVKKRKLCLDTDSQMGSLTKHTTAVKENCQLRKRLNQTFFTGGPNFSLQREIPECAKAPRRSHARARRRLNSDTKQQLITSTFSPRNRNMICGVATSGDPEEEF